MIQQRPLLSLAPPLPSSERTGSSGRLATRAASVSPLIMSSAIRPRSLPVHRFEAATSSKVLPASSAIAAARSSSPMNIFIGRDLDGAYQGSSLTHESLACGNPRAKLRDAYVQLRR